jgi:hypothetical protein
VSFIVAALLAPAILWTAIVADVHPRRQADIFAAEVTGGRPDARLRVAQEC